MHKRLIQILVSTLIIGALVVVLAPTVFATQIIVQTDEGKQIVIRVNAKQPIEIMKSQIVSKSGIAVEQQILLFNGTILENEDTLTEYNIQKNAVIQLQAKHIHKYADWVIIVQPTCNQEGERQKSCSCGDIVKEAIPMKQMHTPSAWIKTKKPTYEEQGQQVKRCTVCNKELEVKAIDKLVKSVVSTKPSPKPLAPQTGDLTPNRIITMIACIAGFGLFIGVLLMIQAKKEEKEKDNKKNEP